MATENKRDEPSGPRLSPANEDARPDQPVDESPSDAVEAVLDAEARIMRASLRIPATGKIPDPVKTRVRTIVGRFIEQRGLSLREVAQHLGGEATSASMLSCVLRGKYSSPDDDILRRLTAWMEAHTRRESAVRQTGLTNTAIVRMIRMGCDYAKTEGCMVLLHGPSGCGKSFTLQNYCTHDLNAIYLRLQSTHLSPTSFLRLLAEACGLVGEGSKARLMESIVAKLGTSHRLLCIDEWHQAGRDVYEAVRDLHDVGELPIVLMGTEETGRRVEAARLKRGSVWSDQFCSRIGLVLDLTCVHHQGGQPQPLYTSEEIRAIFKSDTLRITRDGVDFLQALACSVGLGCLRIAARCYAMGARLARKRGELTSAELRTALRRLAVPGGEDDSAILLMVAETGKKIRTMAATAQRATG